MELHHKAVDHIVSTADATSLVLHGARMWRAELGTVHLMRTSDDLSRHRRGAVIHPHLDFPTVTTADGHLTVHPAVAAVQVGLPGATASTPHPMESLIAADSLLGAGKVTKEDLDAALAVMANHAGIGRVRTLLPFADGRHTTVGETRLSEALRALGYEVEPQYEILLPNGSIGAADFRIKGTRALMEFDGMGKYAKDTRGAEPMAVLRREKTREDYLRQQGYGVGRVTWPELDLLKLIDAKVRTAIQQADAA